MNCPLCHETDVNLPEHVSDVHPFELEQRQKNPQDPLIQALREHAKQVVGRDLELEGLRQLRVANRYLLRKLAEMSNDPYEGWLILDRNEVEEILGKIHVALAKAGK